MTYKPQMTNIPSEVIGRISRKLEPLHLHPIHRAYGSMLNGDDNIITVLVHRDTVNSVFEAYKVIDYDCKEDVFIRCSNGMSYPEALIEMGNRIKE